MPFIRSRNAIASSLRQGIPFLITTGFFIMAVSLERREIGETQAAQNDSFSDSGQWIGHGHADQPFAGSMFRIAAIRQPSVSRLSVIAVHISRSWPPC